MEAGPPEAGGDAEETLSKSTPSESGSPWERRPGLLSSDKRMDLLVLRRTGNSGPTRKTTEVGTMLTAPLLCWPHTLRRQLLRVRGFFSSSFPSLVCVCVCGTHVCRHTCVLHMWGPEVDGRCLGYSRLHSPRQGCSPNTVFFKVLFMCMCVCLCTCLPRIRSRPPRPA